MSSIISMCTVITGRFRHFFLLLLILTLNDYFLKKKNINWTEYRGTYALSMLELQSIMKLCNCLMIFNIASITKRQL